MSRSFTRQVFDWLRQVRDDDRLTYADFVIAFTIADHINRETGDAWPALQTIADLCKTTKNTVIASTRRMAKCGHLEIEPGRAGRGHSTRYRLTEKVQSLHLLADQEKVQLAPEKVQLANVKGAMVTPEPLYRTAKENRSARSARNLEFVTPSGAQSSAVHVTATNAPLKNGAIAVTMNSTDPFAKLNANLADDEIPW